MNYKINNREFKAVQYTGNSKDAKKVFPEIEIWKVDDKTYVFNKTQKCKIRLRLGDYIMELGEGNYIPCSASIFEDIFVEG